METRVSLKYFVNGCRLKETLPDLISCQQTAYVKNRFIGEGGRLIEISNVLKLRGYIVIDDIEKAFDSLRHSFLLTRLKKIDLVMIL